MQQIDSKRTSVPYSEKIVLRFHPSGYIVVDLGNTRFHASADEVVRLIESRAAQSEIVADMLTGRMELPV